MRQEVDRYWALRRQFRWQGVYRGVIEEVVPYGALPAFDYEKGTEVVTFDSEGVLVRSTVTGRRFFATFREVPYSEEARLLASLREAMPNADELRVIVESTWVTARRGHFAVRYPEERVVRLG